MIAALLAVAAGAAWLAAIGLWRLPTALDRLHLVAFVSIAGGFPLLLAAVIAEGASPRVFKLAAIVGINLLSGAAGAHAIGRALAQRGDAA